MISIGARNVRHDAAGRAGVCPNPRQLTGDSFRFESFLSILLHSQAMRRLLTGRYLRTIFENVG